MGGFPIAATVPRPPNRMSLFVRLVRAQLAFGIIFASYLVQLGLVKVFRRWRDDPATGHEEPVLPPWLTRRQARLDEKNSKRMLAGMLRQRGVYIKLGQVLSIMGGFLPPPYIKRLETLQDAVPPRSWLEMRRGMFLAHPCSTKNRLPSTPNFRPESTS